MEERDLPHTKSVESLGVAIFSQAYEFPYNLLHLHDQLSDMKRVILKQHIWYHKENVKIYDLSYSALRLFYNPSEARNSTSVMTLSSMKHPTSLLHQFNYRRHISK